MKVKWQLLVNNPGTFFWQKIGQPMSYKEACIWQNIICCAFPGHHTQIRMVKE